MNAIREDTGRVMTLAIAGWAMLITVAAVEGAFAHFEAREVAVFATLASLYAAATFFMDAQLRRHAARFGAGQVRAVAVAAVVLLGIALARQCAPVATFVAPLATFALAAAAATLRRRARSASSAKSPGATPAAT